MLIGSEVVGFRGTGSEVSSMKLQLTFALVLLGVLALSTVSYRLSDFRALRAPAVEQASDSVAARYRLDASQSRFMVRAFAGGLLWFKGHDHFIAARDFTGEA